MAETKKLFSPEEKLAFEQKYNLGVYSHEAMIELLMQQDKRIQQLEERLMEVGKRIKTENYDISGKLLGIESLADKWK